jgi:hypothetical protein
VWGTPIHLTTYISCASERPHTDEHRAYSSTDKVERSCWTAVEDEVSAAPGCRQGGHDDVRLHSTIRCATEQRKNGVGSAKPIVTGARRQGGEKGWLTSSSKINASR